MGTPQWPSTFLLVTRLPCLRPNMANAAFKDSLGSELDQIKPNVSLVKKHVKNSNAQFTSLMVMYMRG